MDGYRKVEILHKKEIKFIDLKKDDLFLLTDIDGNGNILDDARQKGDIVFIAKSDVIKKENGSLSIDSEPFLSDSLIDDVDGMD